MNGSKRAFIIVALGVAAAITASFYFSYSAGCVGDTKGGSLGNPTRALELESWALVPSLLAMLGIAMFPVAFSNGNLIARSAAAVLLFVVSGVMLLLIGIQFELWGVSSCLLR